MPSMNCCDLVSYHEELNPRHRKTMEDRIKIIDGFMGNSNEGFFSVYDGHGGMEVAAFLQQNLHQEIVKELSIQESDCTVENKLERAYIVTDVMCCKSVAGFAGSTAITVLLLENEEHKKTLYTSNVGDSRAVISHRGKASRLSVDHVATQPQEVDRIVKRGGFVMHDRVLGVLAVSRSFGDRTFKDYVVAQPNTSVKTLEPAEDYPFLVIGCDGLWNEFDDQEIIDFVSKIEHSEREIAAKMLTDLVLEKDGDDNITAVVIFF
uniref:Protein phosphatase 2C putative n=1 Tax=Albugo laibachii Nc14 TaxID=890382 RepID=F0WIA4_9STRA|nr:protein phosphatase 2C putative [Albugo laibachii Nc14]|eukprot:CCA20983.1 protein phosphatase 2C putative [Albugo laibachii Nc14]